MSDKEFIDDFVVTVLDINQRELYRLYLKEIIVTSLSSIDFAHNIKDNNELTIEMGVLYNFIDIEYIPKYEDSPGEVKIIEEYSDIIGKNTKN